MIISHKHKFIFIKTEKTAGTSIEIALSKFCGPDDIITPIGSTDDSKRSELGYRGPQNYFIPFNRYSKNDLIRALSAKERLRFFNHAGAGFIKRYIDKDIWHSYFKFSFERNPWDKVLSWYYWRYKVDPRPSITDFVQSREANIIKGFELYSVDSEIVVDKVFFFEQLVQAMEEVSRHVGLPEIPVLPSAKAGHRRDKRHYRNVLSDEDRRKIEKVYAKEIAYFKYEW